MKNSTLLMDAAAVDRTVSRLAHEIIERGGDLQNLCLVGILRRGVPLAQRLCEKIFTFSGVRVPIGSLDITLYRDDLSEVADKPALSGSKLDFSVVGKTVVLVDDVLYTGRTARAALDAVTSLGRPARIQLVVLVDRGHRELPIRGDYVGKNVPTARDEVISVKFPEFDGVTCVELNKLN